MASNRQLVLERRGFSRSRTGCPKDRLPARDIAGGISISGYGWAATTSCAGGSEPPDAVSVRIVEAIGLATIAFAALEPPDPAS